MMSLCRNVLAVSFTLFGFDIYFSFTVFAAYFFCNNSVLELPSKGHD